MTDLSVHPPGPTQDQDADEMTPVGAQPVHEVADDAVLACGERITDLVDQVDAGRLEPDDAHQASCSFCQSALRDAASSGRALDLLRADRGPVPAGLVDRALDKVRQTRGSTSVLDLPVPGALGVAGGIRVQLHVLAGIARTVAAGHPGVTVARSSAVLARDDRAGGGLHVALGLVVDGRTPLPALAALLRPAVRDALRHATGLRDVGVELAALDLVAPESVDFVESAPQLPGTERV